MSPFQPEMNGPTDAFVTKFSADGGSLVYSTFFGGANSDTPNAILVESSGSALVVFETRSVDLPLVRPALPTPVGDDIENRDGYLARLSPDGRSLVSSTYLGGGRYDDARAVTVDVHGNVYVAGRTSSKNFPTSGALRGKRAGPFDAFLVKLSADEGTFLFGTYLGGKKWDIGWGLAVDNEGYVYVTGATTSPDLPVRRAVQSRFAGAQDAYLMRVRTGG